MKVKICGLFRPEDIKAANTCRPDYIGFVFANKGHRRVTKDQARSLHSGLDPAIQAVGVFLNDPIEKILDIAGEGIIDIIQLHGQEDEAYISRLRSHIDLPIIKAFRISSKEDIIKAEKSSADYILLDNGEGGTGESFDWSILSDATRPFFLAGGLGPDNIAAIPDLPLIFCLDVSSGVETNKQKDPEKMLRFMNKA